MSDEKTKTMPKTYAMSAGDGENSYAQNSGYQKAVADAAKEMINEAICNKLDFKTLGLLDSSSCKFQIADLGCSVGPNTFIAMQNIIENVDLKYHSLQHQNSNSILEFQVFFNDHANNDFNTLFTTLPMPRKYFAAGVPGSFHGRLFPKSTLHFVYSSYALHWLSQVPREIVDSTSPAWNKGSIYCTGLVKEVAEAYSAQYKNDMESFLNARAQELVPGGLMVINIPARQNGIPMCEIADVKMWDMLGTCLIDMAKKGLLSEEKVNSFNMPMYYPSLKELEDLIQRNGRFTIEKMDKLSVQTIPQMKLLMKSLSAQSICAQFRAVHEGVIKEHFGDEFVDQIFNVFTPIIKENFYIFPLEDLHKIELFIILKRVEV